MMFASFLVFEFCIGVFWPAMATMRSKYVPEEGQFEHSLSMKKFHHFCYSFSSRDDYELFPHSIKLNCCGYTSPRKTNLLFDHTSIIYFQDFHLKIIFTSCVFFLGLAAVSMSLLYQ